MQTASPYSTLIRMAEGPSSGDRAYESGRLLVWPHSDKVGLGGGRKVRLYLPPGYQSESGPYPSVWFQDGQHTFAGTSSASWLANVALDRLINAGLISPVVAVGIDNAGNDRATEYCHFRPFPRQADAGVGGQIYERLVIDALLPSLAEQYNLDPRPERTAIVGSSLGALVSYHISHRRPDVFGLLGMLSPYLAHLDPWTGEEEEIFASFTGVLPTRIWLDVGGMESTLTVDQVVRLREAFIARGYRYGSQLRWHADPDAAHNEAAWAHRLPSVLLHLFGEHAPASNLNWPTPPTLPVGETPVDVAPVATYTNGMQDTAMHANLSVIGVPGVVDITGQGQAVGLETGITALRADLDDATATTDITVSIQPSTVTLDVEVRAIQDPGTNSLTLSWLPLRLEPDGVFRGRFRLPRGIGLDGTLSRDSDGAQACDAEGKPLRSSGRVENDLHLDITVTGWMPPDDAAYTQASPPDQSGSSHPGQE